MKTAYLIILLFQPGTDFDNETIVARSIIHSEPAISIQDCIDIAAKANLMSSPEVGQPWAICAPNLSEIRKNE